MNRRLRRVITPSKAEERLIDRCEAFSGRLVRLVVDRVRLPDGSLCTRELILHPGAVAILPIRHDRRVLLVNQYRHPVCSALWEIPAGKLEPDEAPLACARRELLEETGYEASTWEEALSFYTTPGFSNEEITLFLAQGLVKVTDPVPGEIASLKLFTKRQLEKMVDTGEIRDGKTLLALFYASGMLWGGRW